MGHEEPFPWLRLNDRWGFKSGPWLLTISGDRAFESAQRRGCGRARSSSRYGRQAWRSRDMASVPPFEYWLPCSKVQSEAVGDHPEFTARETDRSDKRPRNVSPISAGLTARPRALATSCPTRTVSCWSDRDSRSSARRRRHGAAAPLCPGRPGRLCADPALPSPWRRGRLRSAVSGWARPTRHRARSRRRS